MNKLIKKIKKNSRTASKEELNFIFDLPGKRQIGLNLDRLHGSNKHKVDPACRVYRRKQIGWPSL